MMNNGLAILPGGPLGSSSNIDYNNNSRIQSMASQPKLRDTSFDNENLRRSQDNFLNLNLDKPLNFQGESKTVDLRSKHGAKIKEVKEMGFHDKDDGQILQLLDKHSGNV